MGKDMAQTEINKFYCLLKDKEKNINWKDMAALYYNKEQIAEYLKELNIEPSLQKINHGRFLIFTMYRGNIKDPYYTDFTK